MRFANHRWPGNGAGTPATAKVAHEFLIDGQRHDVLIYGRLATDPWPEDSGIDFDPSR